MAAIDIQRLHYTARQFLGAIDMQDEQTYGRDMRRRHNLGGHLWGIVVGLELEERPREGTPGEVDIYLRPGLAVDGYGREIVVLAAYKLDSSAFASYTADGPVEVWIAYDEEGVQPAGSGYALCAGSEQFTRTHETFRIVTNPDPPSHDSVTVGGQPATRRKDVDPANPPAAVIPDDETVPYQQLPDEVDNLRWLVRLGSVIWNGSRKPPAFGPNPASLLQKERQYTGLVGAQLVAPAGQLTIRDRNTDTPLPNDDKIGGVATVLEGSLEVDRLLTAKRDVQIHGGQLDLRDSGGGNSGTALTIGRGASANGFGGADLNIAIGKTSAGKNRLVVGTASNGTLDAKLAVRDDGAVRIDGSLAISGTIDFDKVIGDRLMLWGAAGEDASYGLGIEGGTLYARAHQHHRWYVGKQADDGTSAVMDLTQNDLRVTTNVHLKGVLDFDDVIGDRLMLWGPADAPLAYGLGIEGGTLYSRAHLRHRWYVGRNRDDGTSATMELDSNLLNIKAGLSVSQSATINGDLTVLGKQNIIRVETQTFAHTNTPPNHNPVKDTPREWTMDYTGKFAQIPTVFVVFQGFSLWGYDGNTNFTPNSAYHSQDTASIPQHMFVRVTSVGLNSAAGVSYCSESGVDYETDNTMLFTMVALGRSA
jgi:hypothetical protein